MEMETTDNTLQEIIENEEIIAVEMAKLQLLEMKLKHEREMLKLKCDHEIKMLKIKHGLV